MNFLTADQRIKAIEMLSRAPDEVLLSAMVDFRKVRHFEEGMKGNVNDMLSELGAEPSSFVLDTTPVPPPKLDAKSLASRAMLEVIKIAPVERKNVNPGLPSIGKIGSGTKDEIMALLSDETQPPKKYAEHLKLLWSRGEVQFDGVGYFL